MADAGADVKAGAKKSAASPPNKMYAGDVSPRDAWALLANERNAVLVDCRTRAEWNFVGVPDLSSLGKKLVLVEWQAWPAMGQNPAFADELVRAGVSPDVPVIFLCRSGGRSRAAAIAMTERGFRRCYNLAGGFEGPQDDSGHRGAVAGWKHDGLPWSQE